MQNFRMVSIKALRNIKPQLIIVRRSEEGALIPWDDSRALQEEIPSSSSFLARTQAMK